MNIKVRIVKDSKWLKVIMLFCLAGVLFLLFKEIKRTTGSPSTVLFVFFNVFIMVLMLRLLILNKISVSAGYVEFNERNIFVHYGANIYVGNWDLISTNDIVYKGDSVNLYCCSVGNQSIIKITGEKEMTFQLHFPSRAHYISILSFIHKLELIKEHDVLLLRHPDMYKYMFMLDKKAVLPGQENETGNLPLKRAPVINGLLFHSYCFSPPGAESMTSRQTDDYRIHDKT